MITFFTSLNYKSRNKICQLANLNSVFCCVWFCENPQFCCKFKWWELKVMYITLSVLVATFNIHAIFIFLKCTHATKDRTTMRRKVAARMISVLSSVISSDDSDDDNDDDWSSSELWLIPESKTEDWATLSPVGEWIESRTGTHLKQRAVKSLILFK